MRGGGELNREANFYKKSMAENKDSKKEDNQLDEALKVIKDMIK